MKHIAYSTKKHLTAILHPLYTYTYNDHISPGYSGNLLVSNICFIFPMRTLDKPCFLVCVSEKMLTIPVYKIHKKFHNAYAHLFMHKAFTCLFSSFRPIPHKNIPRL